MWGRLRRVRTAFSIVLVANGSLHPFRLWESVRQERMILASSWLLCTAAPLARIWALGCCSNSDWAAVIRDCRPFEGVPFERTLQPRMTIKWEEEFVIEGSVMRLVEERRGKVLSREVGVDMLRLYAIYWAKWAVQGNFWATSDLSWSLRAV